MLEMEMEMEMEQSFTVWILSLYHIQITQVTRYFHYNYHKREKKNTKLGLHDGGIKGNYLFSK